MGGAHGASGQTLTLNMITGIQLCHTHSSHTAGAPTVGGITSAKPASGCRFAGAYMCWADRCPVSSGYWPCYLEARRGHRTPCRRRCGDRDWRRRCWRPCRAPSRSQDSWCTCPCRPTASSTRGHLASQHVAGVLDAAQAPQLLTDWHQLLHAPQEAGQARSTPAGLLRQYPA